MRTRTVALLLLVAALTISACGGGSRDKPEDTIARWVDTGDCGLMSDRYVSAGYGSAAAGRRACQKQADRTPKERYRVETTDVRDDEARVVLAVAKGRLTFWLIPRGERGWQIDGYEERRGGNTAAGMADVMAAFERRTGERLDRLPELSSPPYEILGFREFLEAADNAADEVPDRFDELAKRFGVFNIYVASDVEAAKSVVRGDPDERGIHWQRRRNRRGGGFSHWGADKRHANLVLSWAAGKAKRTDRSFDLLDSIVRRAAQGGS